MVWAQLSINKPHLAYLILGGFTSLFMLCSLFIKEKLYIGEATVATICGIIFGPHAASLFDPGTWGNTDQITLEVSRIVLVVQCFAVGVELPKSYMERHWKSVTLLLIPVMTFGWLITSLFIWWMIEPLTWLEALCCAACVTATDPVLASSVVGKGKFAGRVPKHLRDLLSAESGCNDGMAFPFIYLSLYLIQYRPHASEVTFHWICFTILYECIFGAFYGFMVGYGGRHAIKWAEEKQIIDRESFLVFYFVLALFCAGTGSLLGIDDLLVGFSCGVGFSNDGWFTQKTEESHVSNVIDLLLNLAYFVFLGSVIPWQQYNAPELGITPWRLVVIAILVIFFRRIPIMLALKPIIQDIKTWREALFAGHFGPIGVGAIFAAILARAELETDSVTPLSELPALGEKNYLVIQVIWPVTTFLVISSILVHGSSVAVFTLGKRINTLSLTMSYTQANDEGPSWMNRLPRIASTSRNSMSKAKGDDLSLDSSDEKLPQFPPGTLPPVGLAGNFLRRQKEEDNPSNTNSRASSLNPTNRRKKWELGVGPGGPISQSAIAPQRKSDVIGRQWSGSDDSNEKGSASPDSNEPPDGLELQQAADERKLKERDQPRHIEEPEVEAFEEGSQMIIEDEEGNVLSNKDVRHESELQKKQDVRKVGEALEKETTGEHAKGKYHPHERNEGDEIEHAFIEDAQHPRKAYRDWKSRYGHWNGWAKNKGDTGPSQAKPQEYKRGPAHAYQYGKTIIVEDEDGEVVKKYDLPGNDKDRGQPDKVGGNAEPSQVRQRLQRMGTWAGLSGKDTEHVEESPPNEGDHAKKGLVNKYRKKSTVADDDDDRIRFTVDTGGRRLSKQDFIRQIQQLDPKSRCEVIEESDVPEALKREARQDAAIQSNRSRSTTLPSNDPISDSYRSAEVQKISSNEPHRVQGADGLTLVDSAGEDIPFHSVPDSIVKYSDPKHESAAQRRRRAALARKDSDDDGTQRIPPSQRRANLLRQLDDDPSSAQSRPSEHDTSLAGTGETQAERRRRLAALGEGGVDVVDSDSDDDGAPRQPVKGHEPVGEPAMRSEGRRPGIRFAEAPTAGSGRVQWGDNVGRKGRGR